MRSIDFSIVLGSVVSHRQILDLFDVFDDMDWSKVPLFQARGLTPHNDPPSGRTANHG